ncbi:hypothetical protein BSLG_002695 [Batrachochytrium salamandrivorans]|nr:hypothetical protein BSLG_002695 [Batrachochytrium salamandrivorans]
MDIATTSLLTLVDDYKPDQRLSLAGVLVLEKANEYQRRLRTGNCRLLQSHSSSSRRALLYWHRAEAYIKVFDFDSAILNFRQHEALTSQIQPECSDSPPLLPERGSCYKLASSREKTCGISSSTSVYVLSRRMAYVAYLWGQCLMDRHCFHTALVYFKLAHRLKFRVESVLLRMVFAKIGLRDTDGALKDLWTLTEIEQENVDLYILRAKLYKSLGNPSCAHIDLQRAVQLFPNHPEIQGLQEYVLSVVVNLKNKASEQVTKNQPSRAIDYLNQAIELDPKDWSILFQRGTLLNLIQNFDGALKDLFNALTSDVRDVSRDNEIRRTIGNVYNKIGIIAYQNGQPDEAISKFTEALKFNPDEPVVWKNRADSLFSKKEYTSALRDLKQCYLLTSDKNECGKKLNEILTVIASQSIALGDFYSAIDNLNQAISFDSGIDNSHFELSRAYYFLGLIDKARQSLSTVLQLTPTHQEAHGLMSLLTSVPNRNDIRALPSRRPLKKTETMSSHITKQTLPFVGDYLLYSSKISKAETVPLVKSVLDKLNSVIELEDLKPEDPTISKPIGALEQLCSNRTRIVATNHASLPAVNRTTLDLKKIIHVLPLHFSGQNRDTIIPDLQKTSRPTKPDSPLHLSKSSKEHLMPVSNPNTTRLVSPKVIRPRSVKDTLLQGVLVCQEMGSTIDTYLHSQEILAKPCYYDRTSIQPSPPTTTPRNQASIRQTPFMRADCTVLHEPPLRWENISQFQMKST